MKKKRGSDEVSQTRSRSGLTFRPVFPLRCTTKFGSLIKSEDLCKGRFCNFSPVLRHSRLNLRSNFTSKNRSQDVKGLANEVRGHYSRQAPSQNHKHPQGMREEHHDATSDISSLNHSSSTSQNGKVSIRPYTSKRKSVLNGSSYPSAFGQ